jgi:hypothetical protein
MKRTLLTSVTVVALALSAATSAASAKPASRAPHRLPPHEGLGTQVVQPENLAFAWSVPDGFEALNGLLAGGNVYPSMAWL